MKKISLLLVSVLLIACMAGSAMAASSKLIDSDTGAVISDQELYRQNGEPLNMKFMVDTYSPIDGGKEYTLSCVVTPWENQDGVVLGEESDISISVIGIPSFTLPTINAGTTGSYLYEDAIIRVVMDGAPLGATYKINVGATREVGGIPGKEFVLTSASTTISNVPEFPTVALPVAAILGLVFIFGRKKDGL